MNGITLYKEYFVNKNMGAIAFIVKFFSLPREQKMLVKKMLLLEK